MEAAAERIEAELGPIDVWINNAMTAVLGEGSGRHERGGVPSV